MKKILPISNGMSQKHKQITVKEKEQNRPVISTWSESGGPFIALVRQNRICWVFFSAFLWYNCRTYSLSCSNSDSLTLRRNRDTQLSEVHYVPHFSCLSVFTSHNPLLLCMLYPDISYSDVNKGFREVYASYLAKLSSLGYILYP